ncbi:methyltransferase [soil metagenome]
MQDQCAMKVCTDSCLFGAWIYEPQAKNILDVGTGTGLLALMLAQRHPIPIDAVEIDAAAFSQVIQNIQSSPWRKLVKVFHADINDFNPSKKYDVIVSNPPFFANYLKSPDPGRNTVLHDETLTLTTLLCCLTRLLDEKGKFYIMLPPEQAKDFEELAAKIMLQPSKKLLVKENANKNVFRIFSAYQYYTPLVFQVEELIIRNENHTYTPEFSHMLKDFYLNL